MEYNMSGNTFFFNLDTSVFTQGPTMPEARMKHCVVQLNKTHFFIHGGKTGENAQFSYDTIIFDMDEDNWRKVKTNPTFPCGAPPDASKSTCALFNDKIIVPMYEANPIGASCTAIFDLSSSTWTKSALDQRAPTINGQLIRLI